MPNEPLNEVEVSVLPRAIIAFRNIFPRLRPATVHDVHFFDTSRGLCFEPLSRTNKNGAYWLLVLLPFFA